MTDWFIPKIFPDNFSAFKLFQPTRRLIFETIFQ